MGFEYKRNVLAEITADVFINQSINRSWRLDQNDWVVRDANNHVASPLFLDGFIVSFLFFCCLVGLPLNLFIAIKIVISPHLNCIPRNILQLSLILCNIFTLIVVVVELVYYYSPSDEVCKVYVSIVDLPYLTFFLNLLLTMIDRHVAITDPLWHRENITVYGVSFWLVFLDISLALGVNWVHIGAGVVHCEIQLTHSTTQALTLLILLVACIALRVTDYAKTRQLLPRDNGIIPCPPLLLHQASDFIEMEAFIQPSHPPTASSTPRVIHAAAPASSTEPPTGLSVHVTSETLARMEMQASKAFITGLTLLLLLPCPRLVFALAYLLCLPFFGNHQCNTTFWLGPYFQQLISLHAVVHPIVFLWRNKEFFLKPVHRVKSLI